MKNFKIISSLIFTAVVFQCNAKTNLAKSVKTLNQAFSEVQGHFSIKGNGDGFNETHKMGEMIGEEILGKIDESRETFVKFLASHKYTSEENLVERFLTAKSKLEEVGHYLQTMLKNEDLKRKVELIMKSTTVEPMPGMAEEMPTMEMPMMEEPIPSEMPSTFEPLTMPEEPVFAEEATPGKPMEMPEMPPAPEPLTTPEEPTAMPEMTTETMGEEMPPTEMSEMLPPIPGEPAGIPTEMIGEEEPSFPAESTTEIMDEEMPPTEMEEMLPPIPGRSAS